MKRIALPASACALALLFAGCGPMQSPLPPRFDEESQKKVDDSWNRAFAPAGRFDHQGLLDVMVGVQAYQLGVDSFSLRSEKRIAGGKVIMEVQFDREKSEADRFEVTLLNEAGKLVRSERFSRKEVEDTHEALFGVRWLKDPNVAEPPGIAAQQAEREARWNRIREIFPEQKAAAPPPRVRE